MAQTAVGRLHLDTDSCLQEVRRLPPGRPRVPALLGARLGPPGLRLQGRPTTGARRLAIGSLSRVMDTPASSCHRWLLGGTRSWPRVSRARRPHGGARSCLSPRLLSCPSVTRSTHRRSWDFSVRSCGQAAALESDSRVPASHAASHGGHTGSHGVDHVDGRRAGNLCRVPQSAPVDGATADF